MLGFHISKHKSRFRWKLTFRQLPVQDTGLLDPVPCGQTSEPASGWGSLVGVTPNSLSMILNELNKRWPYRNRKGNSGQRSLSPAGLLLLVQGAHILDVLLSGVIRAQYFSSPTTAR